MADSVGLGTMKLSLYGYFPINIKVDYMNIIIEYEDGSEDCFKRRSVDYSNYAVFDIINDLQFICIKKPVKIKFRNFKTYKISSKDREFFINFFKKYE